MLVEHPAARHGVLHASSPIPRRREQRVAFGTSGHRGSSLNGALQRGAHPRHHPGDLRVPRASRAIDGPLFLGIDTHALSEPAFGERARGARRQRRRGHDRPRRRLHADAGRLARDPDLQPRPHGRARRRHRHHAVAQSARGRRLQVQPAERRPGRHRASPAGSRTAPTQLLADGARRRAAHAVRARARARRRRTATTTSTPTSTTSATSSTWTRSAARGSASASIRSAARASPTGRRSPSATGSTSTVVNDDGRSDVPLHDRRLGRQDPHGLLVALRDGAA